MDLEFLASTNPWCIICVSKTWFDNNFDDCLLNQIGKTHFTFRCDDSVRRGYGGGVAIFVPKFLVVSQVVTRGNDYLESLWITLRFRPNDADFVTVFVAYRTPSQPILPSTDAIIQTIADVCSTATTPIIMTGDYNYQIDWETHQTNGNAEKLFLDCVSNFGFSQYVTEPTCDTGNTLDLLFSNFDFIYSLQVLENFSTSIHKKIYL